MPLKAKCMAFWVITANNDCNEPRCRLLFFVKKTKDEHKDQYKTNFLNKGIYMHLQNQPRRRDNRIPSLNVRVETLPPSYPQVHVKMYFIISIVFL